MQQGAAFPTPGGGGAGPLASLSSALRAAALSNSVRSAAAAVSVAAVGSVAYVRSYREAPRDKQPGDRNLVLPRPLMEAVCGGLGEIAQICVLYPLESLKVKCQADGLTASEVARHLLSQGGPAVAVRALYAGFVSAALCSVLVGSVHYCSFCISRRVALQALDGPGDGSSGSGRSHQANLLAASMGAIATALVESPVELFRHQAQAGTIPGNFLGEMARAVQKQGPGALYWGFLPFLAESFPYDLTELGTYSQLRDAREAAQRRGGESAKLMAALPDQAWDLAIGAAAGVAACLISMPLDVVKVRLQTHPSSAAVAAGMAGQLALFWQTGAAMVAAKGPGALFCGLGPRLAQQVPSTTICWWAIERCRDALEPFTKA